MAEVLGVQMGTLQTEDIELGGEQMLSHVGTHGGLYHCHLTEMGSF